MKKQKHSH